MTQKIIVQDGNVVYTTPGLPAAQSINFTIEGQLNVTGAVNVNGSSGTAGQVLTSQGTDLPAVWGVGGGGGGTVTLPNTQIAFGSTSDTVTSSANLVYNSSSNILSVGTTASGLISSAPGGSITIAADASISLTANGYEVVTINADGSLDMYGPINVSGSSGTAGQVITSQGAGLPAVWGVGGGGSTTLANTQIAFGSTSDTVTSSTNLVYDNSTDTLIVGDFGTFDGHISANGFLRLESTSSIYLNIGGTDAVTIDSANTIVIGSSGSGVVSASVGQSLYLESDAGNNVIILGSAGDLSVNGSAGTVGQVLTSQGTDASPTWESPTIPQNIQAADYTLVLSDSGKHIFHPGTDGPSRTYTIPANASVAFPIGTVVTFVNQNGAGSILIAITSDVMRLAGVGSTGTRTLAANGVGTALKIASTEWIISGAGLS
jgi:hypothetical protein